MKIWAGIVETSLREKLPINKQQHGFMGKKNEPTAVCLEIVNGELHCVFGISRKNVIG